MKIGRWKMGFPPVPICLPTSRRWLPEPLRLVHCCQRLPGWQYICLRCSWQGITSLAYTATENVIFQLDPQFLVFIWLWLTGSCISIRCNCLLEIHPPTFTDKLSANIQVQTVSSVHGQDYQWSAVFKSSNHLSFFAWSQSESQVIWSIPQTHFRRHLLAGAFSSPKTIWHFMEMFRKQKRV